jgi:hypothetical protein
LERNKQREALDWVSDNQYALKSEWDEKSNVY